MKVLITGTHGAQGSYLVDYLKAEQPDVEVVAFGRSSWDLTDEVDTFRLVNKVQPDRIFHLAGRPEIADSFNDPLPFYRDNVIATVNLLEAVRQHAPKARVLVASSCEVYGQPMTDRVDESHPMNPCSPYAASKAAADLTALMYARVYGLHVVVSRLFNLINPRRSDLFSTQWASQIVEIEQGKANRLEHGNLVSSRTLLDVRDVVRGYWMLLHNGAPGEAYNFGSDKEVGLADFLGMLRSRSTSKIHAFTAARFNRPVDIRTQVADSGKFIAATGWKPRYSLDESIDFLMKEVREQVA